jgi:predicted esterase
LTVVVGMGIAWGVEHRLHIEARRELEDANKGKLDAETGWQHSVVEHNKTLRVIEENRLTIVGHSDGTTTLQSTR